MRFYKIFMSFYSISIQCIIIAIILIIFEKAFTGCKFNVTYLYEIFLRDYLFRCNAARKSIANCKPVWFYGYNCGMREL